MDPASNDHAHHDPVVVARFAAGDAAASEAEQARALVASCADCAALAADVQLLQSSMQRLPQPRRTRDFRLSAEQAEQLRASGLQRLLRALAGPRAAVLRPLAGAAMTLGLALAVLGTALPGLAPGPASAPVGDTNGTPQVPAGAQASATTAGQPSAATNSNAATGKPQEMVSAGPTIAPKPPDYAASPALPGQALASPNSVNPDSGPTQAATASSGVQSPADVNVAESAPPPPDAGRGGSGGGSGEEPDGVATSAPAGSNGDQVFNQPTAGSEAVIPPVSPQSPPSAGAQANTLSGLLVYGGLALAAAGLVLLLAAWLARRRFTDPLLH